MNESMDRPAIRALVIEALHRATGLLNEPAFAGLRGDATRDLAFADIELDSLSILEVLMELEDATGVELDPDLVPELGTLDRLVDHIEALRGR